MPSIRYGRSPLVDGRDACGSPRSPLGFVFAPTVCKVCIQEQSWANRASGGHGFCESDASSMSANRFTETEDSRVSTRKLLGALPGGHRAR